VSHTATVAASGNSQACRLGTRKAGHVVLEHAVLEVVPGREPEFEVAFSEAMELISSSVGCSSVRLSRSLEHPNRFLLLVEWESVEAHTDGFRRSGAYERWRELLHHFYAPFPEVGHFIEVLHTP
jgi:heme-degrading monooxygenase HmoA